MILADKIITLRKKAGWSQEELASQLGVTRQSVSKWEGAQSVPDLDKVVQMSRLFGVSTDYLLKDELEEEEFVESEADETPLRRVTMEQAARYLALRKACAPKIALAVAMCIVSPVVIIFLSAMADAGLGGISEDLAAGLGVSVILVLVACGVGVLVWSGTYTGAMDQLLEEGDYTRKKKARSGVMSTVSLIYWLSVTAIFLFYTFGPKGNGQPQYSWFIWAVGGVLYAAVMGIVSLVLYHKDKM